MPSFFAVHSLSRVRFFVTPWTAARQASLSITNSRSLLRLMSIESVMPSNHPILCHPLLLLPSVFPSIKVFSSELALSIRWPEYWSFSINPSNEYSGLISFRMDWFDLLAVQGTLKSLLQPHNSKASILLYYLIKQAWDSHGCSDMGLEPPQMNRLCGCLDTERKKVEKDASSPCPLSTKTPESSHHGVETLGLIFPSYLWLRLGF